MRGVAARVVLAVYRAALVRYPRSLLRPYAAEMVAAAEELVDEAVRSRGARGALVVALRLARDLARPLPPPPSGGRDGGGGRGAFGLGHALGTAVRSLRRDPRFTGAVVGVVGMGLALNALVLAAVNAYLVRPIPYPEPERLYEVRPADHVGWKDVDDVFEKAASWDLDAFTLVGEGEPRLVRGAWVTPDFFALYGLRPALGRTLLPEEAGDGAAAVAVISDGLWRDRFGRDPAVLGRTFTAYTSDRPEDAEVFTVVGVLPRDAWHFNAYTDVLTPLRTNRPVYAGRLRTDVPPDRAEDVLTRKARAAATELLPEDFRLTLRRVQDAYSARARPRLLVTQAAALLVLLIACANAGVLVLVRGAGRARELAVRRALGAGGSRLAAPLVAEGMVLAMGAGLLGALVAGIILPGIGSMVEARIGQGVPGGVAALRVDITVLGIMVVACGLIGALFAVIPLWTVGRRTLGSALGTGSRAGTDHVGARRLRGFLVGAELALSLTLLIGAGLLVRSALHLERRDLGFDPQGIVVGNVGLRQGSYPDEASRIALYRALVEGVSDLPDVVGASAARSAPFASDATGRPVETEEGGRHDATVPQITDPSYFGVMGVPVLRGRGFTDEDGPGTVRVAVVSDAAAQALWPGEDPLGHRVRFTGQAGGTMAWESAEWLTVVGVVPDLVASVEEPRPMVYVPYAQSPGLWMSLVLRVRPGAPSPMDGVAGVLHRLDPDAPLYGQVAVADAAASALAPSRFFAALLGVFSAFAFLLAVVGLYAVVAYAARQRRREVAIRVALGAHRTAVQGLFLRQAIYTVAPAVLAGWAGGRILGGALSAQLHGVAPGDPVVALAGALLLGSTALLAVWLPARSAARADPMGVLREE